MDLTVREINNRIHEIRGQKVMLDKDLAELYNVEVKRLNEQVKRNIDRFPLDFMFQLNEDEVSSFLRSQNATLENKRGKHSKYLPYAFTEHGILMLSSVLRSKTAIEVNIQIMRTFVALRRYALTHDELAKRIDELENRVIKGEEVDRQILDVLKEFLEDKETRNSKVGFIK